MNWNIIWHQAITGPILHGIFIKKNQTAAFRIPVTQEGSAVRLKLRNDYGKKPYRIESLTAVYEGKPYSFTLRGSRRIEVPVHTAVYTDALPLPLKPDTALEVRIYYRDRFEDDNNIEEGTVLYKGNATEDMQAVPLPSKDFEKKYGLYKMVPVIESVEIRTEAPQKTIVAFGDSITAMSRWTKPLAARLLAAYGPEMTLVNSGISGNCLTYEKPGFFQKSYGVMGTKRYERDVLSIPHVHAVIMAFGINDISYMTPGNATQVNVQKLMDETARMAQVFHENGLRVTCQTLTFRKGSRGYTEEMEGYRRKYNEWVRSYGLFDYVVDVEPHLAAQGSTDTYREDLHQGDFLHPSQKGGAVMADCYDLEQLTGAELPKKAQ